MLLAAAIAAPARCQRKIKRTTKPSRSKRMPRADNGTETGHSQKNCERPIDWNKREQAE